MPRWGRIQGNFSKKKFSKIFMKFISTWAFRKTMACGDRRPFKTILTMRIMIASRIRLMVPRELQNHSLHFWVYRTCSIQLSIYSFSFDRFRSDRHLGLLLQEIARQGLLGGAVQHNDQRRRRANWPGHGRFKSSLSRRSKWLWRWCYACLIT